MGIVVDLPCAAPQNADEVGSEDRTSAILLRYGYPNVSLTYVLGKIKVFLDNLEATVIKRMMLGLSGVLVLVAGCGKKESGNLEE